MDFYDKSFHKAAAERYEHAQPAFKKSNCSGTRYVYGLAMLFTGILIYISAVFSI